MIRSARVAIALVFFANGFAYGTWVAHLPLLKARLNLSDGSLGIALLFAAIASLVTLPLAGAAIARFGSRGICRVASLAAVGVLALPYVVPDYAWLLVATYVLGTAFSAMDVSMNAQAVLVEGALGRPVMSSFHAAFSTGGLAGAAAAAALLARGGTAVSDTVLATAGCELAVVAALGAFLRDPGAASPARAGAAPARRTLVAGVALLGALAFFGLLGEGAMADWDAIYLRTSLGASVAVAAGGFAAFSLAMAAGRFVGDALVARFGARRTLVAGAVLAAGALGAALAMHGVVASYVAFALVGFGLANVVPVVFGIAGRLPGLGSGVGIAGVSTLGYAGFLVGPPVVGFVSDAAGLRLALGVVAAGIAVIAVLAPRVRTA